MAIHFYDTHSVRDMERTSIRAFVKKQSEYLKGRVLDFGAGRPGTCAVPEPYREYVSGDYESWDLGDAWPVGPYDAILCTQVMQFFDNPAFMMESFGQWLKRDGVLVATYPTSWDEVEANDLWRFTKAGVEKMLANWKILHHERRAEIELGGFKLALGYGVVALKQ